jgi:molybdopterin synthase catalytic subunit
VRVFVHLFGAARERAGRNHLEIEVRPPVTVGDLAAQILLHHAAIAGLLPAARFAVDREFAGPDTPVREGAEVAFLPPVSGG